MPELTPERYHHALVEQADLLARLVAEADPATPVPSCPGWDLRTLVEHVGQAHRFAARIVAGRVTDPSAVPPREPMPDDPEGRRDWLPDGVSELLKAQLTAGPTVEVYNFTGQPRPWFWLRRMTHETAVHRADATLALGLDYDLEPDLAADAISEWLSLVTSPGARVARPDLLEALRGTGQTLHLHATGEPSLGEAGEWLIRRGPDGVSWEHRHAKGDVVLRGPVSVLLLVLLGRARVSDERVQVFGDAGLAEHWVRTVSF
jgi:uncharacterized protein (TIGR03083 family)